jgi:hypothetical protein
MLYKEIIVIYNENLVKCIKTEQDGTEVTLRHAFWIQIMVCTPTFLNEVFRGFLQSLQTVARTFRP